MFSYLKLKTTTFGSNLKYYQGLPETCEMAGIYTNIYMSALFYDERKSEIEKRKEIEIKKSVFGITSISREGKIQKINLIIE